MSLLDKASLVMTPNAVKESKVYSIIPSNGNGDFTFTRGTLASATLTNDSGFIETVPYNLLTYSEQFNNVAWGTLIGASVTANTTTAPNGTSTADTLNFLAFVGSSIFQSISIPQGNVTLSVYAKVASGTKQFRLRIDPAVISTSPNFTATTEWQRFTFSVTTSGVGTSFYIINSDTATAGNLYIWGAQLVQGSVPKDYFFTTDRLNVPRLNYDSAGGCPSLLLEPLRTNTIRNSTMQGAVVGTPGTLPTNWAASLGLTQTIVSKGIENGLDYIDYKLSGIASTANSQLQFEGTAIINASNGQNWSLSLYAKLISSTILPTSVTLRLREATASGTFVADGSTNITISSIFQRFVFTRTNTGVLTEKIQPMILFTTTIGQAYDFTIRVYATQMELGAYVTSYIPTTTGTVTRNADVCNKSGISSLIGQTEGTIFVDFNLSNLTGDAQIVESGVDANNRIRIRRSTNNIECFVVVGGIQQANIVFSSQSIGNHKLAFNYKTNDFQFFLDGVASAKDTLGTVPAQSEISIGTRIGIAAGTDVLNSSIRLVAFYPIMLTSTECIALTT